MRQEHIWSRVQRDSSGRKSASGEPSPRSLNVRQVSFEGMRGVISEKRHPGH